MAKIETEVTIKLNSDEKTNLVSVINKLTDKKIGFNTASLSEDENKIVEFLKTI